MRCSAVLYNTALITLCIVGGTLTANAHEQGATITSVLPKSNKYAPVGEMKEVEDGIILIRENKEIEDLRGQIGKTEVRIRATEKEIKNINAELSQIYKKKNTLEAKLDELTLTNKQNEMQMHKTEGDIERGKLTLQALDSYIENNAENLEVIHKVLKKNFQQANEFEIRGKALILLHTSLSEVLLRIEEIERYSKVLNTQLSMIKDETRRLKKNKNTVTDQRIVLERKQKELEDRRKIYKFSIDQQKSLVRKTRNNEKVYQDLLKEKQGQRLGLQQEIYEYESRIEYLRDPSTIPHPKKGLLRIPFDIRAPITQQFGETAFARANALKYGRPFHDGTDFGTPVGTPLVSAADGAVIGAGNTDIKPGCQSWGKWIAIKHGFGLTTLYAHLSLVKVRIGQRVTAGELIGYSGNTGFSTGPHLHFGVYDSNGIRVIPYEQVTANTRCHGLLVPVAAQEAKLNPLSYLSL